MRGQHNKLRLVCPQCSVSFERWPSQAREHCSAKCARIARSAGFEDRFWQRVDKPLIGCWPWTASRSPGGYGKVAGILFGRPWRHYRAHRVAYELTYGPLADGAVVRHVICNNPPCCRPDHLQDGTTPQNVQDRVTAGRSASGDRHGTRSKPESLRRGSQHHRARFTEDDIRAIREAQSQGESRAALARRYGVSAHAISSIVLRKTWAHV